MGTNFKFYTQNSIDVNGTYSFTSSTESLANYLYDNKYATRLTSSGSDDVTPEVYIVTFSSATTASAIFLGYHNFKNFTIDYSDDSQSSWTNFSSAISETTNIANYNFYEFTEVAGITDLRVTANTTQTTDVEKVLGQLRLINLLGEVSANPFSIENPYDENSLLHGLSDGGNVYVQFGRKIHIIINFDDATEADLVIFRTLKDRFAPFFIYPNGADSIKTQEPFRVQDLFYVNYINSYTPNIRSSFLLDIGSEISLELLEV